MPARKITYELKLKNIKHLLYGKQYNIDMGEGVEYFPVWEEKLGDDEFLRRHFGLELLPEVEKASREKLADLMGRGSSEGPWKSGTKWIIECFCAKIGKKDEAADIYPNMETLIERNGKLFLEKEWKVLAASLENYLREIRDDEADKEIPDKYRIPGPQLDRLLGCVEDCLTAYDRRKAPKYLAMALSWLLIGALVRTMITELSGVLEDYREALRWDEEGKIEKGQIWEIKEWEVAGASAESLYRDQAAGTSKLDRQGRIIPQCLTPIPMTDHSVGLVGRDNILEKVHSMLEEGNRIALVSGLGGIGKTAVMRWVCSDIKEKGNYVAWINCGRSLKEDLLLLGDAFGIQEEDPDMAYKRILDAVKSQLDGKLYIFMDDLARQPDDGELGVLNSMNAHIMVTSRQTNSLFPSVDLDVLGPEDALTMFFKYYNRDSDHRYAGPVRDIVTSVGSHTLLVELLAKAAARTGGTLEGFTKSLADEGAFDVFRRKLATAHDGNENRTIEDCVMKLYEISRLSEEQQRIMKLFSIFTPEKEIYWKVADWAGLDMDAVDELVERAWLERNGPENNYTIHQIIRDSLARQLKNSGEVLKIEEYDDLLAKAADTDSYMPRHLEYAKVRERLTLAEDIADHLAERTAGMLTSGNSQEQEEGILIGTSTLYHNMAGVYEDLGEYGKALEYYKKDLAISERVLGTEHPSTATTYHNMANVYYYQGDYSKALEYYGKDLAISERVLGCEHPSMATTYHNMAYVYKIQGNYEKALEYYGKALSISERVLGVEHPDTATTYNNMSSVFRAQGDYEKALAYCRKALTIYECVLGPEHPDTATTYNDIAIIFSEQGDYKRALAYCRKALAIYERVLGHGHPYTGIVYSTMAMLYYYQGDYGRALEYFGKDLAINERVLGTEHPDTATTYHNMAGVYENQGEYEKALEYYGKALAIRERVLGTEHPDTAATYNNMALVYSDQGDYGKALEYYGKALAIRERVLGTEHPSTAATYNNMAGVFRAQGEYEKALEYYGKALSIRERVLGTEHPDTATTYHNMAGVFRAQGEYEKALEYYEKALSIRTARLGKDHPDTKATIRAIERLKSLL